MVAVAVTAVLLAALVWSRLPATTAPWTDVVALDELRRAGVVYAADEEIFVVADGEGVVAFQAMHSTSRTNWCRTVDPRDGSRAYTATCLTTSVATRSAQHDRA